MEVVKVELSVGKETKEVIDLLSSILKKVKANESPSQIFSELFEPLVKAVEGVPKISEELTKDGMSDEVAYAGKEIISALK